MGAADEIGRSCEEPPRLADPLPETDSSVAPLKPVSVFEKWAAAATKKKPITRN